MVNLTTSRGNLTHPFLIHFDCPDAVTRNQAFKVLRAIFDKGIEYAEANPEKFDLKYAGEGGSEILEYSNIIFTP